MSEEPEELSVSQVASLRRDLERLIPDLETALEEANLSSKPVELDQQSVGRVSRIDAIQQQQMSAAGKRSIELRLQQARVALRAVEEGAYGFCRRCDEPIGYRRLTARPETPFCLACQSGRESR